MVKYLNDNPTMKIELQGHTDTQGDDKHNLELSHNRAKAVYEYLISKGISKDRMTYKGYGETQPVITDEEIAAMKTDQEKKSHIRKNRRTVYKITAI
ncbi:MAG: OmpA family protein [Crocinitomicaceae bacterium]|nr:OmpA family protein [Crocinitomicaceae bacterium]